MSVASNKEWQPYYDFLDKLRKSGKTNMFGATPYLMRRFSLVEHEARPILSAWMKEFSEEKP